MTATRLTVENRTRFLVRREYRPLRVAALVGIVVIWEALSRSGWVSALFLPSPLGVLAEGVDMARSGELARAREGGSRAGLASCGGPVD